MSTDYDLLGGSSSAAVELSKTTFLQHVFSTTDEGKAEIFNVLQYGLLGVVPIVIVNKLVQKFIPEADPAKSSLEIVVEIILQLSSIFIAIILIHRSITFFTPYSGFPYGHLLLTNSVLTFLVIVLSIQTKVGIKVNILFERLVDLWNGTESSASSSSQKEGSPGNSENSRRVRRHAKSQADHLDSNPIMPNPLPISSKNAEEMPLEPVAANSLIGGLGSSSFF